MLPGHLVSLPLKVSFICFCYFVDCCLLCFSGDKLRQISSKSYYINKRLIMSEKFEINSFKQIDIQVYKTMLIKRHKSIK